MTANKCFYTPRENVPGLNRIVKTVTQDCIESGGQATIVPEGGVTLAEAVFRFTLERALTDHDHRWYLDKGTDNEICLVHTSNHSAVMLWNLCPQGVVDHGNQHTETVSYHSEIDVTIWAIDQMSKTDLEIRGGDLPPYSLN